MITKIVNAKSVKEKKLVDGELWLKGSKISAPLQSFDTLIDAEGMILSPGFIDLQINGGYGKDLSSDQDACVTLAEILPKHGVCSFLATLVSLNSDQYHENLPHLQSFQNMDGCAELLGIHLEGPFINPSCSGAHDKRVLREASIGYKALLDCYGSLEKVKLITLAPEVKGCLQLIPELVSNGIRVSLGHTMASFDETKEAIEKGATLITHLFNAMRPFHHRDPGTIGYVLGEGSIYYSVIADGIHLHPATLNLSFRANGNNMVLISDAVSAMGCSKGGAVYTEEKKLAGSTFALDAMVREVYQSIDISIPEVLEMVTLRPAKVLGIDDRKGKLDAGYDADLVLLDKDLHVKKCWVRGKLCKQILDIGV